MRGTIVPHADETTEVAETVETENTETPTNDTEVTEDADQFPREYVEKLRKESAGYRDRAKSAEDRADALARELFTARVAASQKLADPSDLEYNADLLEDSEKLTAAINELIAARPHYAARKMTGTVGQGVKGDTSAPFSLLDRLKQTV
jgi:hypothetical protein